MSKRSWTDVDRELLVSILWTRTFQGGNAGVRLNLRSAAEAPLHFWADAAAVLDTLVNSGRWLRVDPAEPHLIEFRADGWTIQHPLRCRPNLFTCPVNRGEQLHGWPLQRDAGVYECDLEDGALVIGRQVEEGASRG